MSADTTTSGPGPQLSVCVPTYGRPECVRRLVERLVDQTVSPERFELILVDEGSPEPVSLEHVELPFRTLLLRQANSGPASARNLGLRHACAPLALFLNDDALPARDLLEVHLRAHAELRAAGHERVAVLGAFPFSEAALQSPFTQVLAGSDLLFDAGRLRDRELHDWTFFWTCNFSLETEALRAAGGFDARRSPYGRTSRSMLTIEFVLMSSVQIGRS